MKRALSILVFFILVSGFLVPVRGSHIVGGDLQFISMNDQVPVSKIRYKVIFKLYMDCIDGNPEAISRENSALFVLYNGTSRLPLDTFEIGKLSHQVIPPAFSNDCINNPPATCLLLNTYEFVLTLDNIASGYYLATNNCCRNESIVNIRNPAITGASYFIYLPQRAVFNNSAVFANVPPQIICINNPFFYDHSAFDPDGDSLTYEFSEAFTAKTSTMGNGILAVFSAPPYPSVEYMPGFTAVKPMAGNPQLEINEETGAIQGTPNIQGRFVVAVYCHEWRNGVRINTIIREFQFVVTNCSRAVVANIPQYSDEFNTYVVECKNFEVKFDNLSTGGFSYAWDFGVPDANYDVSTDFEPTFTYPDTGEYVVKLVVNRGSTCPDSISRLVKIYPTFNGNYNFDGLPCPNAPIQFSDSSWGTSKAASRWSWNFGDGGTSDQRNPVHVYSEGGYYNVVLIAKNEKGFADTTG